MNLYKGVSATVFLCALALAGCRGDEAGAAAGPGGPGGGMPPMPVEAITLAARPVERANEYIATVKSRRSSTIQPQAEGFITRIVAQPGQRVGAGSVLMQIDARSQEASVASLESLRASRDADLQFARQQADRMKKLYEAGAVSQQEYEQAATAVQTTQAQLQAVDAQIREQRVQLAYHNVTAPTSGIVGDIPVRVGDRVTRSTVLTTVDENAGLELYINVPVQQAPGLRTGLPVRILDDSGAQMGATQVSFVSPSVDPAMQSVLVKAPIKPDMPLRTDQFARVRVVWASEPGLTIPLVAVQRINGQYFVFIAESDGKAHQRPVTLGPLVGNDYVALGGVKEGDKLIVSGTQKIGDGAPVQVTMVSVPPAAAAAQAAPEKQ
jgi:RND family efflux transporter MFP subunit